MTRAQDYHFRYLGVAEGLTNLAVRQIYQDRTGFVWVSTENGLFRFDGERFEAFGPSQGIPANSGVAFGDAPDGSLLVGGDFGLYNLNGNHFEKLALRQKPNDDVTVNWAQGIQSDGKGHTFVGASSGLVQLSLEPGRKSFAVRHLPQVPGTSGPEAYGVFPDGNALWYGCGLQLCRMDQSGTTVMGADSALPQGTWLVIRKDGAGNLWVRGKNLGVFELPRGQTRFRRPDSPVPPETLASVPMVDSDGRILLPSSKGLLIRDETGWRKIDGASGLHGTVYAAFEDRQQSLWIGLAGRGLARWQGYREWTSYTESSGLPSDVVYEVLPRPNGSLCAGTEAGLFCGTRQNSRIVWKGMPGLVDFPVHSVRQAPGGDLWVGTETRGIARVHAGTGAVEWFDQSRGLTNMFAYTVRLDRRQQVWAATEKGLFVAKAPYRAFSRIEEVPATRFWSIAEGADGTLWAGSAEGLFVNVDGHWNKYTQADGLSGLAVLAVCVGPDGKVWVGYRHGGGIDRISLTPKGLSVEKGIQRAGTNGLVYFLGFDAAGKLWAGTERGVDIWDGVRWGHYDTSDGLAWDDCNLNAFAAEADGTVWIGTSGGLSRFRPRPRPAALLPLQVFFTRLVMGRLDLSGQSNPSVNIQSNALTARYTALNAPRQSGVVFRYRLTPVNSAWPVKSAWKETTQRELEFAELAPGSYRLEVEARDLDGVWNGGAGQFAFEIRTPWYRAWWFIAVCALAPLLTAVAMLRFRMLGAARRESELVRLVEERTQDLRLANENLLRLSSLDPLTGLANRRVFDETLGAECARLARAGSAVSLLLLDVDHFKALNDSLGHQQGDLCLARVAAELNRLARRQVDLAARYGGEEFALILPETDFDGAARLAEAARLAIADLRLPHPASPVAPYLTISVGFSTATGERDAQPDALIAAADHALYRAKRNGRNRVEPLREIASAAF